MRKGVIALLVLLSACAAPARPTPSPSPTPTLGLSPTPLSSPSPTPIIYVVQPGDTLAGIAALYGTTSEAICAFNELEDCSLIYPGDELQIPGEAVVPPTAGPSPTPIWACGPDAVSWADTGEYIGQRAVVEGVVVVASYLPDVEGEPTFLNFHDPYEGYFTAVIWGDDRAKFVQKFGGPPEEVLLDQTVCVKGLIEEYRGSPEIVLEEPSQIWSAKSGESKAPIPETPAPVPTEEAAPLPPPQDLGPVSAEGNAELKIDNDTPYVLTLEFQGPKLHTVSVERCPECKEYSLVGPVFCPSGRPSVTFRLPPGTYEVTARVDKPGITPFAGTWELTGDRLYGYCFYIVTQFR